MTTVKRKSRRRTEPHDPITDAWDAGDPPPPEAFEAQNHELVGDCILFRWAEAPAAWPGTTHPFFMLWHEALKAHPACNPSTPNAAA